MADSLFPDAPAEFDRDVIIEWPPQGSVFACWTAVITDAQTGEPITTVSKMALHFDAAGILWADALAFAGEDGTMLAGTEGRIVPDGQGGIRMGVFRFRVAEMRVGAPRPEPRRFRYHVGALCGAPNPDGTCGCQAASGAGGHE